MVRWCFGLNIAWSSSDCDQYIKEVSRIDYSSVQIKSDLWFIDNWIKLFILFFSSHLLSLSSFRFRNLLISHAYLYPHTISSLALLSLAWTGDLSLFTLSNWSVLANGPTSFYHLKCLRVGFLRGLYNHFNFFVGRIFITNSKVVLAEALYSQFYPKTFFIFFHISLPQVFQENQDLRVKEAREERKVTIYSALFCCCTYSHQPKKWLF